MACKQDGKYCWVVTGIPYSPSEPLAHVISRGIAAYGASASVVSVHADNVCLPEDRWHGEIGHRRVLMVLKDGTSYLQLVADNGKLTAEVKALSTKIEDLEAANEDLIEKDADKATKIKDLIEKDVVKSTKIENLEAANEDLKVEIKDLKVEIKDQKVEIKLLMDDNMKRTKREAIQRLDSRELRSLMILKDLIDASGAREVEGKNSSFNSLVVPRNDDAHFLRMGLKPLRDPTALLKYTQKKEDHDSRAVLCAKLKMVRDFVQQGLPEVR